MPRWAMAWGTNAPGAFWVAECGDGGMEDFWLAMAMLV